MPQIYDIGPTALLPPQPPEGRRAKDFFAQKIRRLRTGLNPLTWVLKASTLPLDHRSRYWTYIWRKLFIAASEQAPWHAHCWIYRGELWKFVLVDREFFSLLPTGRNSECGNNEIFEFRNLLILNLVKSTLFCMCESIYCNVRSLHNL